MIMMTFLDALSHPDRNFAGALNFLTQRRPGEAFGDRYHHGHHGTSSGRRWSKRLASSRVYSSRLFTLQIISAETSARCASLRVSAGLGSAGRVSAAGALDRSPEPSPSTPGSARSSSMNVGRPIAQFIREPTSSPSLRQRVTASPTLPAAICSTCPSGISSALATASVVSVPAWRCDRSHAAFACQLPRGAKPFVHVALPKAGPLGSGFS
jgi:hypothetical protein